MSAGSLARLRKVQGELLRLAEMRLAAAERSLRDLAAERGRLDAFVAEGEGAPLKEAALRSLKAVAVRAAAAEAERDAQRERLLALRRRDGALEAAGARASLAERRAAEARALAEVMEARFAAEGVGQD